MLDAEGKEVPGNRGYKYVVTCRCDLFCLFMAHVKMPGPQVVRGEQPWASLANAMFFIPLCHQKVPHFNYLSLIVEIEVFKFFDNEVFDKDRMRVTLM